MTNPSLTLAKWPQNDQAAWHAAIADGGILDDLGPAAHWAAATRATNIHHYGRWLAFLNTEKRLDADLTPASRCTRESIHAYIERLRPTVAPITVASSLVGLLVVIKALVPTEDWRWLADICNALKRNAKPQRDKRSRVLPSGDIFRASIQKLTHIAATDLNRRAQIVGFRNALMLAMIAACPMRRKNFAALRLGSTLVRSGNAWLVLAHSSEVKNKNSIALELPDGLLPFLDIYLARVRPKLLGKNQNQAVWLNWEGKEMTGHAIYLRFMEFTPKLLGKPLNPHLLRDCAATTLATHSYAAAMAARGLLGHKHVHTTEKYYVHAQQLEASRKINEVLAAFTVSGKKSVI